ncbi:hypothetical protein [Fuscibacter oryzae]|uniref:Uncharacterized protein n=1 Tax=Fuscibacter oryzae TaxID=2803939 RepID=A0A8J7ST08_9RHOB|nr:hypothetical protein [Fuscibacter oryzae]MBL4928776.1 hypothetical protein [Fuscibacter oryzae]
MTDLSPIQGLLPKRATAGWLADLPACDMAQFRRKIKVGGQPIFLPDETSTLRQPCWRLLVQDAAGQVWRVTTPKSPLCRSLSSVQRVYQVARDAGLAELRVRIDDAPPLSER